MQPQSYQSMEQPLAAPSEEVELTPPNYKVIFPNLCGSVVNSFFAILVIIWVSFPYCVLCFVVGIIGAIIGVFGLIMECIALKQKNQYLHRAAYYIGIVCVCWFVLTFIAGIVAIIFDLTK